MAKYELTSPDGQKYEVEAPDDATEQQVMDYFRGRIEAQSEPAAEPSSAPESDAPREEAPAPVEPKEESKLGYVGDVLKESGKGLLQTGANIVNAVPEMADAFNSAAAWAGGKVGLGDGTYTKAPRLELSEDLKPTNKSVQLAADIAPMFLGGGAKVATSAPQVAAKLGRTAVAGLSGSTDGQTDGEQAADLVTVATGALGNKGRLARVAAANAGIGLGTEATKQAVDGKFDAGDLATSTGLSALFGVGGKKAADKIGDIAEYGFGKSKLGKAAEAIDEADIGAIKSINDFNIGKDKADQIELTPGQIFRNNDSELARKIGSGERYALDNEKSVTSQMMKKQTENAKTYADDVMKKYDDAVGKETDEFLRGFSNKLEDEQKAIARQNYSEAIGSVNQALKDTGFKGMLKAPTASKNAKEFLKPKDEYGLDPALTTQARKDLKKLANWKAKDFNSFNKMKTSLNSRANEAYQKGEYELSNIYKSLSRDLKSDADAHVARIAGTTGDTGVPGLWQSADKHYAEMMGDFGKGTLARGMQSPKTDAAAVKKYLQDTNGPETIRKMRQLAVKSPDENAVQNFQDSIMSEIINSGIKRATKNATADFNMGMMGSEIRKKMPHIKEAYKGNQAAIDVMDNLGKSFDIMRSTDFTRQKKNLFDKAGNALGGAATRGLGMALGGMLGGADGGLIGAAIGYGGSELARKMANSMSERSSLKLAELAKNNIDAIADIKKRLNSNNPVIKRDAAEEMLAIISRDLADTDTEATAE